MEQIFSTINIQSSGQGLTDITLQIKNFLIENNLISGLVVLNIMHTSCSLIINENADTNVLRDLSAYMKALVPEEGLYSINRSKKKIKYLHSEEGLDDMPAHIKSALTNNQISFSIKNSKLLLGTWQGIYLFEHRINPQTRTIIHHFLGEV